MPPRPRHHKSGSVILIAVGVLVMVAMVGMTFVLAAYMDRRESASIARGASFKKVALGMLTVVQGKLVDDEHFNQSGISNCPYEAATTWMQQVDGPFKTVNPWEASVVAEGPAGSEVFRRISDLFNEGAGYDNISPQPVAGPNTPNNISGGWYVDTDADDRIDARLIDTGVRDAYGNHFFIAPRIIDLSALVNVNTAYAPQPVVPFDTPYGSGGTRGIPVTDMNWAGLQALTSVNVTNLHDMRSKLTAAPQPISTYWHYYVRCAASQKAGPKPQSYWPVFSLDDQLALLWREWRTSRTNYTGRGRLAQLLGGAGLASFHNVRPFLTTWNSSRVIPLQIPALSLGGMPIPKSSQRKRANLNPDLPDPSAPGAAGKRKQAFDDLYEAAQNSIPLGIPDLTDGAIANAVNKRKRLAAQMAVNIIDFCDADDDVTVEMAPGLGGQRFFGIERMCFLTEAFHKVYQDAGGAVRKYSALEFYNPYSTAVSLKGLKVIEAGFTPKPITNEPLPDLPPGGRLVIVSSIGGEVHVAVNSSCSVVAKVEGLDLSKGVKVGRSNKADGTGSALDDFLMANVTLNAGTPPGDDSGVTLVRQWDDRPDQAHYALGSVFKDYANTIDYTTPDGGGSATTSCNLGIANDKAAEVAAAHPNAKPTPVYVRNGKFVSLGDLARIFHVGPSFDGKSLADNLGEGTSIAQGRFDAEVAGSLTPNQIPSISPACLASEFFTVIDPAGDGIDNDGDWLGGPIAGLTDDPYEEAVYGMLNVNPAPRESLLCLPYITPAMADQIIADRNARPFAASGEVLASIRKVAVANNSYGPNYKIADNNTDDGLATVVSGDLTKLQTVYTRLANLITVRSDSYAVYLTVMRFKPSDAIAGNLRRPTATRRYLAVIDRSDCYRRGDWPKIRMFVAIR